MALRDIQSNIQKAKAARDKQLAASTTATQSGSTSTPTTTTTPKVTSTPKAQPSVTQPTTASQPVSTPTQPVDLTNINLFKPQEQIQTAQQLKQQYGDLLSPVQETEDIQNDTIPAQIVRSVQNIGGKALDVINNSLYKQGVDYIKSKVDTERLKSEAKQDLMELGSDFKTEYLGEVWSDIKKGKGPIGTINSLLQNTVHGSTGILYWLSDVAGAKMERDRNFVNSMLNRFGLIDTDITEGMNTYLVRNFLGDIMDFYENTELAKYIQETSDTKGVIRNLNLHLSSTIGEMLPTLVGGQYGKIPGLVDALAGIYGQTYTNLYRDGSNDEELSQLSPDKFRMMVSLAAIPSTLIEFAGDWIEGFLPFATPEVEMGQKALNRTLRRPLLNIMKKFLKGGISEGIENPAQEEVETRILRGFGSKRELPTRKERFQNFTVSAIVGALLQGIHVKTDIDAHKELKDMYEEFEESLGELGEGLTDNEKKDLFTATLEYEIKNTPNAKTKEEAMYNNTNNTLTTLKNNIETKLETTQDSKEREILNATLEKVNDAIKEAKETHEAWATIIDDIQQAQQAYQQQQEELPAQQTTPQQQGGENLSEQTMGVAEDRINLTDKQKKNFQSKYWSWQKQTPDTVSKFINKISETEEYIESEQDSIRKEKQKTFEGYKTENGGNISESTKEELNNMREEYNELENELKNNDLTEEEKAEYNTDIDGINQNANMLADLGEEYTDFTSKKISSEGIEDADEVTQSGESEMGETKQEISEENGQLEADEELQNETTEEELNKQEEPEKEKVNTFKEDYEAYLKEKDRQKKGEFKENSKECRRDIWTVAKNILTPTMTRIYNINKRIAGRLTQMETQTGINIYRYTQKTQGFADTFNGLSKGQQLEVSKALFDFGALAKEQTEETLQEYKDNEKKKLRDVLTKNGFKDEDIDNLFEVLNDLGTRYKEAGMDITVTDMYFPRTVSDYKGLIKYLNEHSETPIQGKNARTIYNEIKKITKDPTLSDAQKESEIKRKLSENFSPKVSTKTKYSEERQLGLLSDWGAGIYAYYENPVESLASYITSMEQAIQRQLFLGGMKDTQGIDIDIKGQSSDQSVSAIVRDMFEKGEITESQMSELHTGLMAVLNKKGTPRWVRAIKNITYTMALTNYISAINQAEDIGVAIIENKKGLISVLKSIFTKAGIKYDEAGLESAYEMFKTNSKPSDWLFKKSGFNAIDRMGKRSFLNAAWNSMVQTYKNPKARGHMYERLKAMYGDETANHIMDCVRNNNYMVGEKGDQQIDIDVLTDLLYQLGNTQPIYQSSMPVSYLQHPEARWLYALSMFSLRQIDHIIQSTKSAYEEGGVANAVYVGLKLITARMFFNALIGGLTSLLQGDLDDSWIWKLFEGDWEGAGKAFGGDMLKGFLKVWMFSKYDWKTRKNEGLWAFVTNRISPYILQEGFKGRRAVQKALKNDDRKELMTMMGDMPLLGKQAYGRWKYYQDNILVDPFDKAFDEAFDQAFDNAFDEAFDNAFDEAFDKSFDKSFDKAFK